MIVVVFGVVGSGKSTIGKKLANAMNCAFLEGDALHPPANIDKMSGGTPLSDVDREPWLVDIAVQDCERTLREHFGPTGLTFDITLTLPALTRSSNIYVSCGWKEQGARVTTCPQ